jgi:phenylacetate-CoA ligase
LGLSRFSQIGTHLDPEEILEQLCSSNADIVIGPPGVLSRLGLLLKSGSEAVRSRFVLAGAEVLTDTQRDQIESGFQVPVFNLYGCSEFNLLAWECKETGEMHVCDDSVIIEVVRDGNPVREGEGGEVVATGLVSHTMPLIRYRLDDVVTRGKELCSCGRPFPTIRTIQGRVADYFRLPSGRVIHPFELNVAIRHATESWVAQYQIVQERLDSVTVRAVPRSQPSSEALSRLARCGEVLLGPEVEFRVQLVPDIGPDRGGKYRIFKSLPSAPSNADGGHTTSGTE